MQYLRQTRIRATPAEVFAFHERPGALESLTPPWEKVRVIEGGTSILPGSRVVLETRLGPIKLHWVAQHTEYAPPHLFADTQLSGPFASWYHRHRFEDDGEGGTVLIDDVTYELPLGGLGRLFGADFIRNKLDRMFEYRHERTKALIESGIDRTSA